MGAGASCAPTGAVELASDLVDQRAVIAEDADDQWLRDIAWALKDLCYAAWSTEPRRAALAADVLETLVSRCRAEEIRDVVAALAQWTRGISQITRGEMTDAIDSLDAARAAFSGMGDTHCAAETLIPRIMALAMLGRHDEAVDTAQRAQRELVSHGDDRAAAKVSLNLGSLHLRRDSFARAAEDYRKAAVLFARAGDAEHSIMADIGIGDALTARGDFEEALRIYARAGMRADARGFPVLSAMQSESVALLELARGNFAHALSRMEAARRTYERLSMPQHLAIAEKQLGDAYLELKLIPEAIALFEEARSRFDAQGMIDDLAWTFAQLGRAYVWSAQPQRANESLALAAQKFETEQNVVGSATIALTRAELALALGDAPSAATYAEQAGRGFAATNLADRELRACALQAHALLSCGIADEAQRLFEAALERARALQVIPVQVRCLTGKGLIALSCGRREQARQALEDAVELFEQQRTALPADELSDAFLTDHLLPYRELVRIALEHWHAFPTSRDAEQVLVNMERFRARVLAERLQRSEVEDENASTRALRTRANWLRRHVSKTAEEGGDVATAMQELRRAELNLLEHARRQRIVEGRTRTDANEPETNHATLTRNFAAGDALVEYGVIDDELFACVVTGEGVHVRRAVASWRAVQENLRSARFQIESLRHGSGALRPHIDTLTQRAKLRMQRLHDLVWAPLRELLRDVRRVVVVPHAELAALPFCALHDGAAYLVESVEIAIAPSARVAARSTRLPPIAPRDVLVMGVSRDLPHAAREVQLVADAFSARRVAVDGDATVKAFMEAAPQAHLVHLACHAQFRSDNPMFSALHLDDGTLTAEQVERMNLKPATVVLSACETAVSQAGAGDEMFGLVRAFLVAGAARIVGTLWPVDDSATAAVMIKFYRALREGGSPASALRIAQRQRLRDSPHPFYWAAFTVYGGW